MSRADAELAERLERLADTQPPPPPSRRGFASMPPEQIRQISSRGGKAAHAAGTAHRWTPEEAKAAGRKGGSTKRRPKRPLVTIATGYSSVWDGCIGEIVRDEGERLLVHLKGEPQPFWFATAHTRPVGGAE